MKKIQEELQELEAEVARLRAIGTSDARKFADDLEVKMIMMRQKVSRMEMLTIERMREWTSQILADVAADGKRRHEIDRWTPRQRHEMFEALQVAWSAGKFRGRAAADMMGIEYGLACDWLASDAWKKWQIENPQRESQVIAIADMALQRAAHILALETEDPDILRVQSATIKTVLTAGLTVSDHLPDGKGGGRKPGAPRQGLPSASGEKVPSDRRRSFEKKK